MRPAIGDDLFEHQLLTCGHHSSIGESSIGEDAGALGGGFSVCASRPPTCACPSVSYDQFGMMLRKGLELLSEQPGDGPPVRKHAFYQIKLRMWLHRGDPVRWDRPWGTVPARLEEDGAVLITHVRVDRVFLFSGLFYGIQGMNVGGTRRLRIAPHLAFRNTGVPGVIPADAVLTAELSVLGERIEDRLKGVKPPQESTK